MKLVSYSDGREDVGVGVLCGDRVIDINAAATSLGLTERFDSIITVLSTPDGLTRLGAILEGINAAQDKGWEKSLTGIQLLAPIPRPPKILGVALNYRDFCDRGKLEIPKAMKVFVKVGTTVVGPGAKILVPRGRQVTYEGELGVVIGKKCKNVAASNAMDCVAGYTIVNDITANDLVREDIQLTRGKNLDTFCPIGPVLVTKDDVPDPHSLRIQTRVNGHLRQDSNTSQLIFKIPQIIEYFTAFLTLEPGDVIATGTPAGTALQHNPPAFIQPGDVMTISVQGLGSLSNSVVEDTRLARAVQGQRFRHGDGCGRP